MKEKLDIKDIYGYLPYGLQVLRPDCITILNVHGILGTLIQHKEDNNITYSSLGGCKLILRPLSDLYKTISHNGKEIYPIVECAKIAYPKHENFKAANKKAFLLQGTIYLYEFMFRENSFVCRRYNTEEWCIVPNQNLLFDYLHELKIDYRSLIDSGLAIDVNTLIENPYK